MVIRQFLTQIISRDPRLEIVAVVASGEEAVQKIADAAPDVISMDIRLPGIDGLETTRRIMTERPTPIVIVAANVESEDLRISMNAMRAGALSVLEKPALTSSGALEAFTERLCTQLAIMSQVNVITRRDARFTRGNCAKGFAAVSAVRPTAACAMIGIVASTGGPNALVQVLGALEEDFPVPILLVQHITSCFSTAFVEWLGSICKLRINQATNGDRPVAGSVYVAPADSHLVLRQRRLALQDGPLVCMQRPSGSVMLDSMAKELGARAVGVVLTGMGEDGAQGLLAIRNGQGHTIAEHESTAVVYGMPGAAVALGAACESLPLSQISARLRQLAYRELRDQT